MKITTEYTIYFLRDNNASMAYGQRVLARNQNPDLNMPAYFGSEAEALDWIHSNDTAMARAGEFIILPVHRMQH